MEKRGGFFKSNWAYLVWFAIYYTIAVFLIYMCTSDFVISFFLSFIIYGASVGIALSPIGESILRLMQGIKPIQTEQDREYLMPIFEEVYAEALKFTPELNEDIQLYISESMTVNAFAIGRKTIAVTRGAIYTFSPEELKEYYPMNSDTWRMVIQKLYLLM